MRQRIEEADRSSVLAARAAHGCEDGYLVRPPRDWREALDLRQNAHCPLRIHRHAILM
jgi:hypothetical protein